MQLVSDRVGHQFFISSDFFNALVLFLSIVTNLSLTCLILGFNKDTFS